VTRVPRGASAAPTSRACFDAVADSERCSRARAPRPRGSGATASRHDVGGDGAARGSLAVGARQPPRRGRAPSSPWPSRVDDPGSRSRAPPTWTSEALDVDPADPLDQVGQPAACVGPRARGRRGAACSIPAAGEAGGLSARPEGPSRGMRRARQVGGLAEEEGGDARAWRVLTSQARRQRIVLRGRTAGSSDDQRGRRSPASSPLSSRATCRGVGREQRRGSHATSARARAHGGQAAATSASPSRGAVDAELSRGRA